MISKHVLRSMVVIFALGVSHVFGEVVPEYPCYRLATAPVMDGRADDAAWQQLPEAGAFFILGGKKYAVEKQTFFRAGWTDDSLYLCIKCFEPLPGKMTATGVDGGSLWHDDSIEMFFQPVAGPKYFQLVANSAGARWNSVGSLFPNEKEGKPWNWEVRSGKWEKGWLLEIRIPFAVLKKTPADGEKWPANIARSTTTGPDVEKSTCWPPLQEGFNDRENFGRFVFSAEAPSERLVKKYFEEQKHFKEQYAAKIKSAAALTNQPSVLVVPPYLQDLAETGATIVWRSDRPSYGFVEYGEDASLGQKAESVRDGLKAANVEWHRVRVSNLKPGVRYHYRVIDRAIVSFGPYKIVFAPDTVSETNAFTTPSTSAAKVRCVIFNDLHNRASTAKKLMNVVTNGTWDMAFFNGDIFADVSRETDTLLSLINGFIDLVDGHSRPAVFVRGNHETRGAWARHLYDAVANPGDSFYFAMTRGPVRFVVLDCGEDKPDNSPVFSGLNDFSAFRAAEAEWLKSEVAGAAFQSARYRVLIHHIPLYGQYLSAPCRKLWGKTMETAGFDIAINGHTHTARRIAAGEDGNPFPVLVGGGPALKEGLEKAVVMVLDADAARLRVEAMDVSGKVVLEQECLPKR